MATAVLSGCLIVALFWLVPGDAIDALPNGPEVRAQLQAEWGIEGGGLGRSLTVRPGAPVAELVGVALTTSLSLLLPALVLALTAGFGAAVAWPTGALGWRRGLHLVGAGASSVPVVILALATVLTVNAGTWALIERGIVDRPAWFALPVEPGAMRSALAILVLAVGSSRWSQLSAQARRLLDELDDASFMEAVRARGQKTLRTRLHHLVVPTARLASEQVPSCFAGLIVVERAFTVPGAGTLFWQACSGRDWPVAVGVALGAALLTAAARLVAETIAVVVDPRERERAA